MRIFTTCVLAYLAPLMSFLGAVGTARAGLVAVDADGFSEFTDISNAFSGVTLSAEGGGYGASGVVLAIDPMDPFFDGDYNFMASTPSLVFGHDGTMYSRQIGHTWTEGYFENYIRLRADFSHPTNFVSIDVIGNDPIADEGTLRAYDSSGSLLDTVTTGQLAQNEVETLSISRAAWDISFIRAGGQLGFADTVGLDNLHFNAIPEPSTLVLLSIGATGLLAYAVGRRERSAQLACRTVKKRTRSGGSNL